MYLSLETNVMLMDGIRKPKGVILVIQGNNPGKFRCYMQADKDSFRYSDGIRVFIFCEAGIPLKYFLIFQYINRYKIF